MQNLLLHQLDERDRTESQEARDLLYQHFGGMDRWFGVESKTSLRQTERDYNGVSEDSLYNPSYWS